MFEIFTSRAKKVIDLGKSEAKKDNSDCVGTQHILLGLVIEGSGVGCFVLTNNGVQAQMIRDEIEKIVQKGDDIIKDAPYSPRATNLFTQAIEEATLLGHRYVGTEHILLALLHEQESIAVQILMNFGLNLDQIRKETLNLLGFYDRNFSLQPTDQQNIYSVMYTDTASNDCVGRYESTTEELLLNRPLTVTEIHRLLEKIREFHRDKK